MRSGEILGCVCLVLAILHGLVTVGFSSFRSVWQDNAWGATANATERLASMPTHMIRPADWLLLSAACFIHARLGRIWLPRSGPGPIEAAAQAAAAAALKATAQPPPAPQRH